MSDHNSVPSNASASTSLAVIAPEKQSSNFPNRTGTLTLDWRLEAIEAAKITSIIRSGINGDEDFKRALDAMIHFLETAGPKLQKSDIHDRNLEGVVGMAAALGEDYLKGLSEKTKTYAVSTFTTELARLNDVRKEQLAVGINLNIYPYTVSQLARVFIKNLRARAEIATEPSALLLEATGYKSAKAEQDVWQPNNRGPFEAIKRSFWPEPSVVA